MKKNRRRASENSFVGRTVEVTPTFDYNYRQEEPNAKFNTKPAIEKVLESLGSNDSDNSTQKFLIQNMSNRKHEKLQRPSDNGLCYFTSDSDEIRFHNKKPLKKNSLLPRKEHECNLKNLQIDVAEASDFSKNNFIILENKGDSDTCAPLIHIEQEINGSMIISKIHINKKKLERNMRKSTKHISKKKIVQDDDKVSGSEKLSKGGQLLLNRTKSNQILQHSAFEAPRKPPRSVSSSSDFVLILENDNTGLKSVQYNKKQVNSDDKVIYKEPKFNKRMENLDLRKQNDNFKSTNYSEMYKDKSTSVSQLDMNISNFKIPETTRQYVKPSCPNFNDVSHTDQNVTTKNISTYKRMSAYELIEPQNKQIPIIGFVPPDVVNMLNFNDKLVGEIHDQQAQAQSIPANKSDHIGWVEPAKLGIDRKDLASEQYNVNDFHNFVSNMECKNTPVKSFNPNNSRKSFIKEKVLKQILSSTPSKKVPERTNVQRRQPSFSKRAMENTKQFLGKSIRVLNLGKNTSKSVNNKKNIENQTNNNSVVNLLQEKKLDFINNEKDDDVTLKTNSTKVVVPVDRAKNSTPLTEFSSFDFDRIINSPKINKKKKLFHSNIPKDRNTTDSGPVFYHSYKSYSSEFNKDFYLSAMDDILISLRSNLDKIADNGQPLLSITEPDNPVNQEIFAEADIHNEPIYSEILENLPTIPIAANKMNDIKECPIYAKINKKKIIRKSQSLNDLSNIPSNIIIRNEESVSDPGSNIIENDMKTNKTEIRNKILKNENNAQGIDTNDVEEIVYQSADVLKSQKTLQPLSLYGLKPIFNNIMNKRLLKRSFSYPFMRRKDFNADNMNSNETILNMASNSRIKSLNTFFQNHTNRRNKISPIKEDVCIQRNMIKESQNPNFNKNNLYYPTAGANVKEQIEKAVSICRQLPEFVNSPTLVEAERLLLYSSLKSITTKKDNFNKKNVDDNDLIKKKNFGILIVDEFEISKKPNIIDNVLFNDYYIAIFSNGSEIISTQSAEKSSEMVIFPDCNVRFDGLDSNFEIKVDIYLLRLKQLICASNDYEKIIQKNPIDSFNTNGEMISRFCLHCTFKIQALDAKSYSVKENNNNFDPNDNKFVLQANDIKRIPITSIAFQTDLCNEVKLKMLIELTFDNFKLNGFLNMHCGNQNWKRYWCQIQALTLYFWYDTQDCNKKSPLFEINLIKCIPNTNIIAKKVVCENRLIFEISIKEDTDLDDSKMLLFSTDNQLDLDLWINQLNQIGEFIKIYKINAN